MAKKSKKKQVYTVNKRGKKYREIKEHPRKYDSVARMCFTDRTYNDEETAFMKACQHYRKEKGISVMCITEYLTVLKSLGYSKLKY